MKAEDWDELIECAESAWRTTTNPDTETNWRRFIDEMTKKRDRAAIMESAEAWDKVEHDT